MVTLKNLDEDRVAATFHFPGSIWADRVDLVVDLGEHPGSQPMAFSRRDEDWQATMVLRAGRDYRFWYLVDGREQRFERHGALEVPRAEE